MTGSQHDTKDYKRVVIQWLPNAKTSPKSNSANALVSVDTFSFRVKVDTSYYSLSTVFCTRLRPFLFYYTLEVTYSWINFQLLQIDYFLRTRPSVIDRYTLVTCDIETDQEVFFVCLIPQSPRLGASTRYNGPPFFENTRVCFEIMLV